MKNKNWENKSKGINRGGGASSSLPCAPIEFIERETDKEMSAEDRDWMLDMLIAWTLRDMQGDK